MIGRRNNETHSSAEPVHEDPKVSQTPPTSETISDTPVKMDEKEARKLAVKKFNNKPKDVRWEILSLKQ